MSVRPNNYIGFGLGAGAIDLAPTWASMSTRLYAATVERGRESRLDDYTPAVATITLKHLDGKLIPNSTASPYRTSSFRQVVVASAPLVYYRLNESAGTIAKNEVGPSATYGTWNGAPTLGVTGLVANDPDKAAQLGTNLVASAQLRLASTTPLPVTGGWSVAAWINLPAAPAGGSQLVDFDDGRVNGKIIVGFSTGGFVSVTQGGTALTTIAAGKITFGTKHHVCVTYNAKTQVATVFIDGVARETLGPFPVQAYNAFTTACGFGANGTVSQFFGTIDEIAFWNRTLTAQAVALMFGRSGTATQLIPGMQVMIGEGFVGRLMMESPALYWSFNESTGPNLDIAHSAQLNVVGGLSTRAPTYNVAGQLGRGAQFDGRHHALWTSLARFQSTMFPVGTTGMSLVAVVRIDEKNVARKQYIFAGHTTLLTESNASLAYTSSGRMRFFVKTTAAELSTTVVAITTGWHLIIASFKKGSKPVLTVDGVRTSGPASLAGGFAGAAKSWWVGALNSSSTGAVGAHFKGIIDEVAMVARSAISSASAATLLTEYQNKWRPGKVSFRGHAQPQAPADYQFPKTKDARVVFTAFDWTARLSLNNIPPTGPSSSTTYTSTAQVKVPPLWLFGGDKPGARIGRIFDLAGLPKGFREIDPGQSLLLPTTWNVNAFGEAAQVSLSENGALYARREGPIRFDGRKRMFLDKRMITPVSTYSDALGAALRYENPMTGYAALIRNNVVIGNSTFTTSLTAIESENLYGPVTTDRSGGRNAIANDMIEQGRFVLLQYSSGMYAPTQITVLPHRSTADYSAYCYRELRDRVRLLQLVPGSTRRSTADVTIEKETVTIANHQLMATYDLDSAQRNGLIPSTNLLVLDTTMAGQKLDSGRLGF